MFWFQLTKLRKSPRNTMNNITQPYISNFNINPIFSHFNNRVHLSLVFIEKIKLISFVVSFLIQNVNIENHSICLIIRSSDMLPSWSPGRFAFHRPFWMWSRSGDIKRGFAPRVPSQFYIAISTKKYSNRKIIVTIEKFA